VVPEPPQRTTGAIQTVTDHRFLDSLLRSRAWIWILAVGLGGIVAMQVTLLKLNTGISRAVESAATLERQNAELEVQVARLSSDERIRAAAAKLGLVMPDAGAVKFLHSRGERDAARASHRMQPPSVEAEKLLASGGRVPAGTLTATTTTTTATAPVPTATAQPVATASPTPAPTAAPTATPVPAAATAGGQAAPTE
jgi:cell division protein FtsL